ncbi:MAG TPA: DUF6351 family protein, partial [Bryobacteraceae bacterium]|nr:DUF6351 family protein [Bryobacteraceae bacterium]
AGESLSPEQKKAIAGVGELNSVTKGSGGARRIDPRAFCPPVLPHALRYHPVTNPKGARCDVFDHTVNVYGRDPATGFARRPLDNAGVQYGLLALNSGAITTTQFLELNERIGGYDNDGNLVSARSVADRAALKAAYSTGRVTHGGGGLANVPILDLRGYLDLKSDGDLHQKYHSFSLRERLSRANGASANHVLVVSSESQPGMEEYTIGKMDEWLTRLVADASTDAASAKVLRAKPADLVDACYTPAGERIAEKQTFRGGECNRFYPTFNSPRMMAGGPVSGDVLKCETKPIDFRDYRVLFTPDEKKRLISIFPAGVCDWTRRGVYQTNPTGLWQSY